MIKLLILTFLNFTLLGCVSTPSPGAFYTASNFTRTNNKAEIIIFRANKNVGFLACHEVLIDNQKIGLLTNAGFLRKEVSPSKHQIKIAMVHGKEVALPLEVKENTTTYIILDLSMNSEKGIPEDVLLSNKSVHKTYMGFMQFHHSLAQVESGFAIKVLPSLRDSSVVSSCSSPVKFKN